MTLEALNDLELVYKAGLAHSDALEMAVYSTDTACGTKGCLIGWFCVDNPYDRLRMDPTMMYVAARFGLNSMQTVYLFYHYNNADALSRLRDFIDNERRDLRDNLLAESVSQALPSVEPCHGGNQ